jgi:hypothetical protein
MQKNDGHPIWLLDRAHLWQTIQKKLEAFDRESTTREKQVSPQNCEEILALFWMMYFVQGSI